VTIQPYCHPTSINVGDTHSALKLVTLVFAVAGMTGCNVSDSGHQSVSLPENFRALSSRIFSSGEPVGTCVFNALRQEGIKTVVSVDGAVPDVATAKRAGLCYVHLPIGYDGVPKATIASLEQVMKSTSGKILVHCHHGKHRGPAAAVIACMIEGSMTKDQALAALKTAGTSPDYGGLWRDVREFSGISKNVIAQPIRERAEIEPLADSMVRIDHAFERLEALLGKPSLRLSATKEQAVLLIEGFKESVRHARAGSADTAMVERLSSGERQSVELAALLGRRDVINAVKLQAAMKGDCKSCHAKYRN